MKNRRCEEKKERRRREKKSRDEKISAYCGNKQNNQEQEGEREGGATSGRGQWAPSNFSPHFLVFWPKTFELRWMRKKKKKMRWKKKKEQAPKRREKMWKPSLAVSRRR